MTLVKSSLIYSKHKTRGIFIFFIVVSIFVPFALNLSPRLFPEKGEKNITVIFEYNGAFEKDIEKLIDLLEEPLSSLPGLQTIYSVSEPEKGSVFCSFADTKNYDEAYMEVRDCVKKVYSLFPENVQRPVFLKSGLNNSPVFAAAFNTDGFSGRAQIEKAFEQVKGCSRAEAAGESSREVLVVPDTKKISLSLFSEGIIINSIRNENYSEIITPPCMKQIRAGKRITGINDIKNILFSGNRIEDFASIWLRKKESTSEGHINGKKKLILYAEKEGGSSIIEVCRAFSKTAAELGGDIILNKGAEIEKALLETAFSVLLGIISVILIAAIYFRNIYFSVLVIVNICFSILVSAFFLRITNNNLDIITISGMAVVSGLAIDNSIIFLEKYRNINENLENAISETMHPLLFSFLTTCIVFVPLLFASTSLKTMLRGMAVSVSSGLLASFLFTFYFIPIFSGSGKRSLSYKKNCICYNDSCKNSSCQNKKNRFISPLISGSCDFKKCVQPPVICKSLNNIAENEQAFKIVQKKRFLNDYFRNILKYKLIKIFEVIRFYRCLPLLLLLVLSISALLLFSGIEYSPFNFTSKKRLAFIMEFPSGCSYYYIKKTASSVEKALLLYMEDVKNKKNDIKLFQKDDSLQVLLKIEKERACFDLEVADKNKLSIFRRKIDEISQMHRDIYFHYPLHSSCSNNFDITIYSRNQETAVSEAYRLGAEIEAASSSLKTVYHFKTPPEGLKLVFYKEKAHSYLFSPLDASKYIYTLLSSPVISKYYSDGKEIDIRFGSDDIYTKDKLKKTTLSVLQADGGKSAVELNEISELVSYFPPCRIYHKNRQRSLSMSITGISSKRDIEIIEAVLSGFEFCNGCRGEGGVSYYEKQNEAYEIVLLILLAVFFIISVLVVQFESFKIPLLITAGIPASFLIPLAVMKISEIDLTASTALALLLSSGICVNNAILVLSPFKGNTVITEEEAAMSLSGKTGALLTASLTTLLSILPLIFTGTDSLLAPFSIVISSGIAGSVIVLPFVVSASCRG